MYYPNKNRNCCRTKLNPCGVPEPFGVQDCSSDAELIRCCPAIESLTDGNETFLFRVCYQRNANCISLLV